MTSENKTINIYDFDGTICYKDCTFGFWKYAIKKNPFILICIPLQFVSFVLFKLKLSKSVSLFYSYLWFFKMETKRQMIKDFCDNYEEYICEWYLKQKKETDVIVSASPVFLIQEMANRLGVRCVASNVNLKTGMYEKSSCQGREKVTQFREQYPNVVVAMSYGNSKYDKYIIDIAQRGYMVKNYSEKAVLLQETHNRNNRD